MNCECGGAPSQRTDLQTDLARIEEKLDRILNTIRDNGDTSPEQVEQYLNKIGRMIASRKFAGADKFLRSVYARVDEHKHITKKQMAAVDRIEARGSVAAPSYVHEATAWDEFDPWEMD